MDEQQKKPMYIEDGFELSDFKRKAAILKRVNAKIRKYKKLMAALLAFSAVLLLLVIVFAALGLDYKSEINKSELTNELAREAVSSAEPEIIEQPPAAAEAAPEVFETPEALPESPPKKEPLDKIIKLREAFSNDDIVGYLKIDETNIDYAVAQSTDNEYYLNRDLYGEENVAGSIFMDYECDVYELSKNTVIYGHNMRNGSMFHNLRYYADPKYFDEHRYVQLTTTYEETVWEVFSFYRAPSDFYYIQVLFPDDAAYGALVSEMKSRSMYDTGVDVGENDRVLTLSTCSNASDDSRFVLNAKLVSIE